MAPPSAPAPKIHPPARPSLRPLLFAAAAILSGPAALAAVVPATTIAIDLQHPGKAISPDLFGIFFEDLNYAADGGLYAELIQNRSFEYQATDQPTWNALTAWQLTRRGGGHGSITIGSANPVHPHNPHYAALEVRDPGAGVGLMNDGFDGIPVKAGERYDVSAMVRRLYTGDRWAAVVPPEGPRPPLIARLESRSGENLGETILAVPGLAWARVTGTIVARRTDDRARFVLLMQERGGVALDVISLFPRATFHHRPNGLRADLAQAIADLHPRFVRFPGGCLAHGHGLDNMYRWEDTIGPIETRREQSNLWGYHQTVGLGYFEYFQFCEDIGAKPLPVLAAGVCCQNSDFTGGTGQQGLPMDQMGAYVQEVLDLVEYANGPVSSPWGAKRAAAGHPEPFHLEYVGVGNEDAQTPVFRERFRMIYAAMKAQHPEITVVGTVGPAPEGTDYDEGWKFANELHLPLVDEHGYESPQWFWDHLARFDGYDRSRSRVYLGEYAAHDVGKRNTLRSALAEAAYMTSLERNGDVVRLSSYAPLLAKVGHTQWTPDLIYFTGTEVHPSINYYVQQLFSANAGDIWMNPRVTEMAPPAGPPTLAVSAVADSSTGDIILKLVNGAALPRPLRIVFSGSEVLGSIAHSSVLTGDADAVNGLDEAQALGPVAGVIPVGPSFDYAAPANSLTILRLRPQPVPAYAQSR